jgi:hypothetical protein
VADQLVVLQDDAHLALVEDRLVQHAVGVAAAAGEEDVDVVRHARCGRLLPEGVQGQHVHAPVERPQLVQRQPLVPKDQPGIVRTGQQPECQQEESVHRMALPIDLAHDKVETADDGGDVGDEAAAANLAGDAQVAETRRAHQK